MSAAASTAPWRRCTSTAASCTPVETLVLPRQRRPRPCGPAALRRGTARGGGPWPPASPGASAPSPRLTVRSSPPAPCTTPAASPWSTLRAGPAPPGRASAPAYPARSCWPWPSTRATSSLVATWPVAPASTAGCLPRRRQRRRGSRSAARRSAGRCRRWPTAAGCSLPVASLAAWRPTSRCGTARRGRPCAAASTARSARSCARQIYSTWPAPLTPPGSPRGSPPTTLLRGTSCRPAGWPCRGVSATPRTRWRCSTASSTSPATASCQRGTGRCGGSRASMAAPPTGPFWPSVSCRTATRPPACPRRPRRRPRPAP